MSTILRLPKTNSLVSTPLSSLHLLNSKVILSLVFLVSIVFEIQAADITSIRSGNWSDRNIWSTNAVPGRNDNVTIAAATTVTIDVAGSAKSLTTNVGGYLIVNNTLTITSKGFVNILGTIEFNSTSIINGGGSGGNAVNFTFGSPSGFGGHLITANADGIMSSGLTGSVQVSGTRTFYNTADYTYNGTNQKTGDGLPINILGAFTIDKGSKLTLSYPSQSVSGVTNLKNGTLIIPSPFTFTMNGPITITTGTIEGTPSSSLNIGGSGAISGPLLFSNPPSQPNAPAQLGSFNYTRTTNGAIIGSDLSIARNFLNSAGNALSFGTKTITFNGSIPS